MTDLADQLIATLVAPDAGRPWRIALLALAALVAWRFVYVVLTEAPPPPPRTPVAIAALERAPTPPASPRRSFFGSRKERLETAIEVLNIETDHMLAQTNSVRASAGLAQARAQLKALLRELDPLPALPAPLQERRRSVLTQREIEELLDLVALPSNERRELSILIAGRLEEQR